MPNTITRYTISIDQEISIVPIYCTSFEFLKAGQKPNETNISIWIQEKDHEPFGNPRVNLQFTLLRTYANIPEDVGKYIETFFDGPKYCLHLYGKACPIT